MVTLSESKLRSEVLSGDATLVVNLSDLDSRSEAERFAKLNVFTGGMKTMLRRVSGPWLQLLLSTEPVIDVQSTRATSTSGRET